MPLIERFAARAASLLPNGAAVCVGLSGGVDSVVLLHLLHALTPRFGWRLSALHVHHGISPNADAWADFCTQLCAGLSVPLAVERVDIGPLREHGIEAAARQLRYAAYERQPVGFIALAHHADDQAETLLLQLLRGAGVKGVAAMPSFKPGEAWKPAIIRPLLDFERHELEVYAGQHDLSWIEDESNADTRYSRNFLRHRVLPELAQHFPNFRHTLGRSAQHFAEAADLLDEVARQDAAGEEGASLPVARLRGLSVPRAKNLLRHYLYSQGAPMPQSAQLEDMLRQFLGAREDGMPCVEYGGWQVRRYRDAVYVLPRYAPLEPGLVVEWHGETELTWSPLQQVVQFQSVEGAGISLEKLRSGPVTLRLRDGQAALRPHPQAATRSLKNLLQEHGVPPWTRERLPLLYCGETLVAVTGVAVAADWQAAPGEPALQIVLRQR